MLVMPYTYAQSEETTNASIFVQIQVRNSDGQLVTYLEPNKIFILDMELLTGVLDTQPVQQTFSRSGQNFELITLDVEKKITIPDVISKTSFGTIVDGKEVRLVSSVHDGYPVIPSDTVTTIWTIIRPAR